MKNKNYDASEQENLKSENAYLRLKLEMEHGLRNMELDGQAEPAAENQWLHNMMEWEEQFASGKTIRVFDVIGQPSFKKHHELKAEEIPAELARLEGIFLENAIHIDFMCQYDAGVKYRFLTEEFFLHEIDDIRVEGMMNCFIYEEFHPNHRYDLERYTVEYLEKFFGETWNEKYVPWTMGKTIELNGQMLTIKEFSKRMAAFQGLFKKIEIHQLNTEDIRYDLQKNSAETESKVVIVLYVDDRDIHLTSCDFTFGFTLDNSWELKSIRTTKMLF